jgi:hypothetical protein
LAAAALLLASGTGLAAWGQKQPPVGPPQSPTPGAIADPEFGAIAFTADGSFASAWKHATKADAVAKVLGDCVKFRRGTCEVVSFRKELCAAIASIEIGKEHRLTYAGGGLTRAEAQRSALERCNKRARRSCQLRTVVCGDGR